MTAYESENPEKASDAFKYIDECSALTEQVSSLSYFGSADVKLTCLDVASRYIALGSNSGAVFIFNRRLNRSATPLRPCHVSVSCIKLNCGENDSLAVGHVTGSLALLQFPSIRPNSDRKLKQTIADHAHKDHSITCIEWARDGSKVFTADDAGVVVVTLVNFANNSIQTAFICLERCRVMQMIFMSGYLMILTQKRVAIIDCVSSETLHEFTDFKERVLGIYATGNIGANNLYIVFLNGSINCYDAKNGSLKHEYVLDNLAREALLKTGSTETKSCELRLLRSSRVLTHHETSIFCICEFCVMLLMINGAGVLTTLNLEKICANDSCEVVAASSDIVYDDIGALFLLTSNNRVYRCAGDKAPKCLMEAHEPSSDYGARALLTSLQKSTSFGTANALLSKIKPRKDLNLLSTLQNLPIPVISTVLESKDAPLSENDVAESSDSDSISKIANTAEKAIRAEHGQVQSGFVSGFKGVARTLVDTVGGFGAVTEGCVLLENSLEGGRESSSDRLPLEDHGIVEEVVVQRTKTAAAKRKADNDSMSNDAKNSIGLLEDELISADETILMNIRNALTNVTLSNAHCSPLSVGESSDAASEKAENDIHEQAEPVVAEEIDVHVSGNVNENENGFDESEFHTFVESEEGDASNAFDKLMKEAIENKLEETGLRLETSIGSVYSTRYSVDESALTNDRTDIWNELTLPYSCVSFSVSSSCLVICHAKKKKRPRWLLLPYIDSPRWMALKHKAESFVINNPGTIVWRVYKNVAYGPVAESSAAPPSSIMHWVPVASEGGGVVDVALTNDAAWYATKNGEVYVQLRLPEMGILSRCDAPWPLHSIAASSVAVWALRADTGHLVIRAGMKYSPVGLDWVEVVLEGPCSLISICLYEHSGWGIDEMRRLWFTNGVDFHSPFGMPGTWMQVSCPWQASFDANKLKMLPWSVRVSQTGVFVCTGRKIYWSSSSTPVSGHQFCTVVPNKLIANDRFEMVSAGSLRNDYDAITLCRMGEIFLFRLRSGYFYSLPAFPASFGANVVEVCSYDSSVFVLDSVGCIHVKKNICTASPYGSDWELFDTGFCDSPVVSLAVTKISLWLVTTTGSVFAHQRRNEEPIIGTNAKWIRVDFANNLIVNKVRASLAGTYVWVYSTDMGRAWARVAICIDNPLGKSWSEASSHPGVYDLAVGSRVVWSLSVGGRLYRLRGLAAGNPAGNYWKAVPVLLKAISVDCEDRLWAVEYRQRLVVHNVELYPPTSDSCLNVADENVSSINSDDFVNL